MNFIKTDDLIETLAKKTADLLELTELILDENKKSYRVVAKVKDGVTELDLISAGQNSNLRYLVLMNNIVYWYNTDKYYDSEGNLSYEFGRKRDYTRLALQSLRDDYLENMKE